MRFYSLLIVFFCVNGICFSQENRLLDSFFVTYLNDIYKDCTHTYVKQDSLLFKSSNTFNKKVEKVETFSYNKDAKKNCFIEVDQYEKSHHENEPSCLKISISVSFTYKRKQMVYSDGTYPFIVREEGNKLNIYLEGYIEELIGSLEIGR